MLEKRATRGRDGEIAVAGMMLPIPAGARDIENKMPRRRRAATRPLWISDEL
jgi:hypothetical protein